VPVFLDGGVYRICGPRVGGACIWAIRHMEDGNSEGLRRPTVATLRARGLRQLSDAELGELIPGNTFYLRDFENSSIIPIFYLHSGRRMLIYEERFFEGAYWFSNDDLCVESVLGGDLCTPIFKDGDVYRACHPKPEIGCRWFFERIEAGNTEGY